MHTPAAHPRRFAFLGLALVLTAVVIGLGGTSFQRKVVSFQPLGFELVPGQGAWRVVEVIDPATGLREDDAILLVRGETVSEAERLRQLLRSGESTPLVVQRGSGLADVTYHRPHLEISYSYLVLALVGVFYLLIGLYTSFKDRQAHAHVFFFWCLASATLYILSPMIPPRDGADESIFVLDQLARTVLPILTLHLFLIFPTDLLGRGRRFAALFYVPAAALLGFHLDQIYLGARFFGFDAARIAAVDRLEMALLGLFGLLAGATLVYRLVRHGAEWEARRQTQWILAGLVGGYVPFVALYLLPWLAGLAWPGWISVVAVVPLALVPLGFAYAILRYKLLDIGVILRDTISYSLTVVLGIFAFSLIHFALERGLAETELSMMRNFLTFVAGLVIAGVLVPTKGVIAAGLESFQYRHSLAPRRALAELGNELLHERHLGRLCRTLLDRLAEGLTAHTGLYLDRGEDLVRFSASETAEAPARLGYDDLGPELWERDVDSLSAVHLPGETMTAEQRLFAAGYRYVFPLTVRDARVGLVVVGYKFDGEPLNSEDLELTRALLNQTALAIENAQLLDQVHHQLDEVGKLEAHTKGILESSPAGIAVLDRKNRVVEANHAFAGLVEQPFAELVGRPLSELLPVQPLPEPTDGLVEISYGTSSGEERYLELSVGPYELDDSQRVLVVQDVSERAAMELALKEREHLASLGMLAAGVAHEVNTPLTGISSYAQMLLAETDESDPHYELLKKVERQTFRAAQIVNNLLEFSRNRHRELTKVSLHAVLRENLHLLEDRADDEGIEILYETADESAVVLGHEGELNQVFTNLIVNALDAMSSRGEGRLAVSLEPRDDRLLARISDTGPGIPPERLESIFRPFFTSKLNKGGTGLGLAIAYNIVRRHRGTIRAENHHGEPGCTFYVDLPRYETR